MLKVISISKRYFQTIQWNFLNIIQKFNKSELFNELKKN